MKRYGYIFLMITAAVTVGCAKEVDAPETPKVPTALTDSPSAVPGLVRIQVSDVKTRRQLAALGIARAPAEPSVLLRAFSQDR